MKKSNKKVKSQPLDDMFEPSNCNHYIPIVEPAARKKQVLTSVHMSVLLSTVLALLCVLASCTDFVHLVTTSHQATLKYHLYFYFLVPFVLAFCLQPSLLIRSMSDKKFRRLRDQESSCAYCPGNQVCLCHNYQLESKVGKLNDEWLRSLAECDPKLLLNEYDSTTETDQAS